MTISDVQFKNSQYIVYNEDGKEVKSFWDSEGELVDFGQDFLVFERNDQYRFIRVESGDEIANVWRDRVGQFKHAKGDLVVFQKNDQIFTHRIGCSDITELNSRWT